MQSAGGDGLSRSKIGDLFDRHQRAERIEQALQMLERRGIAQVEHRATGGRKEEIWRVVDGVATKATEP